MLKCRRAEVAGLMTAFVACALALANGPADARRADGQDQAMDVRARASAQHRWRSWDVAGPAPRRNSALAFDSNRGVVVLFGGFHDGQFYGDTWEWDGTSWTLAAEDGPTPRYGHAMTFDETIGRVVLFGGGDSGLYADTWVWDGQTWEDWSPPLDAPNPSARSQHALSYDRARGVCVLFGGPHAGGNDTWEWNGLTRQWQEVTLALGNPPAQACHAMAYDTARDRSVLFGGFRSDWDDGWWEWDGATWTEVPPGDGPGRRAGHGMTSFGDRGVLLAGGYYVDASGWEIYDDTWVYDGTAWTQYPSLCLPPLYFHSMAYDSIRDVVVLFGGVQSPEYVDYNSRTWELSAIDLLPGDLNGDGQVEFADINPFVAAMNGLELYCQQYPGGYWLNADCNGDGDVNFGDINAFVDLLIR